MFVTFFLGCFLLVVFLRLVSVGSDFLDGFDFSGAFSSFLSSLVFHGVGVSFLFSFDGDVVDFGVLVGDVFAGDVSDGG